MTWLSRLKNVRRTMIVVGFANLAVVVLGAALVVASSPDCDRRHVFPLIAVSLAASVKIAAMVKMGIAQALTAKVIMDPSSPQGDVVDAVIRHERRMRYKSWLWWTRLAMVITVLQFVGATYLMFLVAKYVSRDGIPRDCFLGLASDSDIGKKKVLLLFVILVFFVALVQCFTGSDILKWRSFYATQDEAWKAHYHEVFDHGIREILCCLGRVQYMTVSDEDEVYTVARLLGDLVAYRGPAMGIWNFLAGLALLENRSSYSKSCDGFAEAPEMYLREAVTYQKFAEAAYTGLLLDFGRNPILFPCTWIFRQGILTPWTRNSLPLLEGDNWWRGHAAAFVKFINLTPDVLRRGRVSRAKCKAAYFVVVLHHLRCVVIAVRGTETPEDLITDGLGNASPLSREDLDGLISNALVSTDLFTHYGHSGIVEAARDLFMQIEGIPRIGESEAVGFLSSLLGPGCECDGYSIRIVGHSLGGAIAALLGIRLYRKFPNLHVYAYGPLPCLGKTIADACSEFVTSIVLDNEFSARLSVGSILRLRAAAITELSKYPKRDIALILGLARRILYVKDNQGGEVGVTRSAECFLGSSEESSHSLCGASNERNQDCAPWNDGGILENGSETENTEFINPLYHGAADASPSSDDIVSQFIENVPIPRTRPAGDAPEMLLPGRIIHIVPQQDSINMPSKKRWGIFESAEFYKAYLADRESFKDMIVSPSMFLDHLPWRCNHAMQKVLEARSLQGRHPDACEIV